MRADVAGISLPRLMVSIRAPEMPVMSRVPRWNVR
jgi:hypothetical protein